MIKMYTPIFREEPRFYCLKNYPESKFSYKDFDRKVLVNVLKFCGWSGFAQIAIALMNQGVILLINVYFSPLVVTAKVISDQIYRAVSNLFNSFRTAVNPQIIKKYAKGDLLGSQKLLIKSTYLSFYLVLYLVLPMFFLTEQILNIWLGDYNEYTVIFVKFALIQILFSVFDTSFYTALYAKGQIKENAILSPPLSILFFPIICLLFFLGYTPEVICYFQVINYFLVGIVIKPCLICKIVNYNAKDIYKIILRCSIVSILSFVEIFSVFSFFYIESVIYDINIVLSSTVIISLNVVFFGLSQEDRHNIYLYIRNIYLNFYK